MKEETYRLIMMIGLWVGIVLFLVAVILLIKNVQEIKTDPIIYGMEKHNLYSCTCLNPSGTYTTITLDDYKINEEGIG